MKFAAPYQIEINCPINYDNIDEFNIKFTENSSFDELKKFIEKYLNHRINIDFVEEKYDISNIIKICHQYDNIYLRIKPWELEYLSTYEDEDINYFFDSSMPIYSYILLEWVLSHKTKGIYIADDLTYNLSDVYEQCNKQNIELRIILNKIPVTNSLVLDCPSLQIYCPQDYDFLNKYYAVGEFNCGKQYDWVKAEVLYRKWFIDHKWESNLEYMNKDLRDFYPTASMPPELTKMRAVCKHRCTMNKNNICSKCERFLKMGRLHAEYNILYEENQITPSLEQMTNLIFSSKNDNIS